MHQIFLRLCLKGLALAKRTTVLAVGAFCSQEAGKVKVKRGFVSAIFGLSGGHGTCLVRLRGTRRAARSGSVPASPRRMW